MLITELKLNIDKHINYLIRLYNQLFNRTQRIKIAEKYLLKFLS
jgi:hypothetical protein